MLNKMMELTSVNVAENVSKNMDGNPTMLGIGKERGGN